MFPKERRVYSYGKKRNKTSGDTTETQFEDALETKQSLSPSKLRQKGKNSWTVKSKGASSKTVSDPFEFNEGGTELEAKKSTEGISTASSPSKVHKKLKLSELDSPKKEKMQPKRPLPKMKEHSPPKKRIPPKAHTSPFKKFLKNNTEALSPRKRKTVLSLKALQSDTSRNTDDSEELASPLSAHDVTPFSSDGEGKPPVKVKREEKKLFTIVRNTKKASECLEDGESQQFMDDLLFLLDGLSDANPLATRCLSALELASKCSGSSFRMSLRAHGMISTIFKSLSDAPENWDLGLCTGAMMFMLTRDKISIDFDRSILDLMFKLLAAKDEPKRKSKNWNRLQNKLRESLIGKDIIGIENLDLSNLTTDALCRESLLSFTLQRMGEWFKDEIRLLGGLDHVVDVVLQASRSVRNNVRGKLLEETTLMQLQRCFKLIENVTYQSVENQKYLLSYKHSSLIESCGRLLHHGTCYLADNSTDDDHSSLVLCLFSMLRTLLNLTHDYDAACAMVCKEKDTLSAILWCAFQLPQFVPENKNFDTLVLSLGLLINLVEHTPRHAAIINAMETLPWYESQKVNNIERKCTPTESLLQLFIIRAEASENANSLTEDLHSTESSLHNASIRMSADGLSLMCGDDLDKTSVAEDPKPSTISKSKSKTSTESKDPAGTALEKAGKHMEDSLVAAYAALLLGLLARDNKENQRNIKQHNSVMVATLQKFLSFMKMMTDRPQGSGFKAVEDVIRLLSQCN